MLFEPPRTQYDVHFTVLGFPVRIHPLFWLIAIVLGLNSGGETPPVSLVTWIPVIVISIVVHELGHALLQRHYGGNPRIVLHGFGGLAITDRQPPSSYAQIVISLAGPFAGFLLAAVVGALVVLSGHQLGYQPPGTPSGEMYASISIIVGRLYWLPYEANALNYLVAHFLSANIIWGLFNLLPIYPFDGGHVSRELCQMISPSKGIVWSLQISVAAGAAMALYGLSHGSWYLAFFCGYLAYQSFQAMQRYQQSRW